jgi:hypothetical protein
MRLLALVLIRQHKEIEMSTRRLLVTATAMAAIAVVLMALTPPFREMTGPLATAQRTVDTEGADVLIASAAGLLAWAVWAWGALGLALTAATALPGLAGGTARMVLRLALPAGARRSAALLLGIGLGIAPLAATALTVLAPPASAAAPAPVGVPDWPVAAAAADESPVPDWPTTASPAPGEHVVLRGDCLWHIAGDSLTTGLGRPPSDGEVAVAVHAWWTANADVIGPDPDLLLPGQVLRPPGP